VVATIYLSYSLSTVLTFRHEDQFASFFQVTIPRGAYIDRSPRREVCVAWLWSYVVIVVSNVVYLVSNVVHFMSDVKVVEERIVRDGLLGNDIYWNRPT
jgi:hypothetical protein